jgi:RNA polymerase sigma-70 factor (ECF subfamily)
MQAIMTRGDDSAGSGAERGLFSSSTAEPDEDAALVRRCRRGDVQAFGLLVGRHETRVRALVARILGAGASTDDVDDTTQDVFVQAWRALPRFRGDAKFSTWLYRVATNLAIKQWHRGKRRQHVVAEEDLPEGVRAALTDPSMGPDATAERRAQDRALRTAVETLPEKQRTAVLLHYFEDYSCEEMAQIIGCSVGTVWSRLHYGCRKLREQLHWLEQA